MTPLRCRVLRCQRFHFFLRGAACALVAILLAESSPSLSPTRSLAFAQEATPPSAAPLATPLHQRIDELVAKKHLGPFSPLADDADFVRRIYLDLTGTIPGVNEVKAFLGDADPQKRTKLIDRLLVDPRHARHMSTLFDVMLMERRPDKHVTTAEWRKYLYDSFMANKPWDVLVKEMLSSDGVDPATRPAAKFVLDREVEPNLMTRDVGRVFFGQDLQCAQCHDHPLVEDYHQFKYYGLYAFFSRSQIFTRPDKKVVLMDNLDGEAGFQSVFDKTMVGNSLPRVLGGKELPEPPLPPGQEWITAPAKDVRHVPKYSRRMQLAAQVASPDNRPFARNIANRLWAQMLGRGIVEPVDFHHVGNPPSNPELLDALSSAIVEMKFDMRAMLREIALSQAYQRSLELPGDVPSQLAPAQAKAATLAQEIAALKEVQKSKSDAYQAILAEASAIRVGLPSLVEEVTKAKAAADVVQKGIDAANKVVADLSAQLNAKKEIEKTLSEAVAKNKEALAKLASDKELAEAVAKIEAKANQVIAESAGISKQVEEKTAAVKVEADKLPPARQVIDAAIAKLTEARKNLIAIEEREVMADEARRVAEFAVRERQQAVVEMESMNAYASATSARAAAASEAQAAVQQVAAVQTEQRKLMGEMGQLQIAMENAKKTQADAQMALQQALQTAESKANAVKLMEQVKLNLDAAAKALPADAELPKLAASLAPKSEIVAQESAKAQEAVTASQTAMTTASTQMSAAQEKLTAASNRMTSVTQDLAAKQAVADAAAQKARASFESTKVAASKLELDLSNEFASRPLRQLAPEQFGWSVLQSTGVYDAYWTQTTAEIEKASPLSEEAKKDATQLAARRQQIEQAVYDKLAPSVQTFVQFYGAGAAQPQTDFFATVDQALFLANGGALKSWLAPSGDNLTGRLLKLNDPAALSEELYLTVFSRKPTAPEVADVAAYLAARPMDRPVAIQELAWGLISSAEFRFNH